MSLLNIITELKKACNHPFLFESAEDEYRCGAMSCRAIGPIWVFGACERRTCWSCSGLCLAQSWSRRVMGACSVSSRMLGVVAVSAVTC